MSQVLSEYCRVFGDVLREHRKALNWTREQLRDRLCLNGDSDLSLQTLATYELATRHLSVNRLNELARALGTQPHIILAEVDRRVYGNGKVVVDLRKLAESTRPELAPAARWARVQLDTMINVGDLAPVIQLSPAALQTLASVCDFDIEKLPDLLQEFDQYE